MKRITAVLRTSEVTEVRRAIFAAGGNRVVIAIVPHRPGAIGLVDWHCGTPRAARGDHVRLSVTVDDGRSEEVVSAIIASAHTGMIEKIAFLPAKPAHKPGHMSCDILAECAA